MCRYGRGFLPLLAAFVRTFAPPRWRPEKGLPARLHLSDCRSRMRPTPGKLCSLSPHPHLTPTAASAHPIHPCSPVGRLYTAAQCLPLGAHASQLLRDVGVPVGRRKGVGRTDGGTPATSRRGEVRRGGEAAAGLWRPEQRASGAAGHALRAPPAGRGLPREGGGDQGGEGPHVLTCEACQATAIASSRKPV